MESTVVIISGLLVDNPDNRARVAFIGMPVDPWPRPYQGSTASRCQSCDASIMIGPETTKIMDGVIDSGRNPFVLCLICCAILSRTEGADVDIVQLTDKKAGE